MICLSPRLSTIKNVPATVTSQSGSAVYVSEESDAGSHDNPPPAEIPSADIPEPIIRHPEFFLDDAMIAIQIENTLFNVHKYQLAKSDFFSEIFKLPKSKGGKPEKGLSPEHPILIQGAHASDFAGLLKVLYASHFSSNPPAPEASLIIPAFRLANLLSFSELRAHLSPLAEKNLDDVDKIVFAREFNITEWLAPAHIRLCKRNEVLSTKEARKLGVDSVLLISHMREKYRSRSSTSKFGTGPFCSPCLGLVSQGNTVCGHCKNQQTCYVANGPGISTTKETQTNTFNSTLEAEVETWVQENIAARCE